VQTDKRLSRVVMKECTVWHGCFTVRRRSREASPRWHLIFVSSVVASSSLAPVPAAHAASRDALAAPVFPGPLLGTPSVATPAPASFAYTCNVRPNTDPGKAAGKTLAPGTAILDIGGCGQALLYLNAPASGHFRLHSPYQIRQLVRRPCCGSFCSDREASCYVRWM